MAVEGARIIEERDAGIGGLPAWNEIIFNAIGARLFLTHATLKGDRRTPRLAYELKLDAESRLKLTTGEPIANTRFGIGIEPLGEPTGELEPIGTLLYTERVNDAELQYPPSIFADVRIPQSQFDELVAAARHGRCPSNVRLDVKGLKYIDYVEHELRWDNSKEENHSLPIKSVAFDVRFVVPPGEDDDDAAPSQASFVRGHINAIAHATGTIKAILQWLLVLAISMTLWYFLRR